MGSSSHNHFWLRGTFEVDSTLQDFPTNSKALLTSSRLKLPKFPNFRWNISDPFFGRYTPQGKLTWLAGKSPSINRRYIIHFHSWLLFHCHVRFLQCIFPRKIPMIQVLEIMNQSALVDVHFENQRALASVRRRR